jgi:pyrimidine-nucleoside phosphorylase
MDMVSIITKKRDGGELSAGEIEFFISGLTGGRIPDYQASALLMAIYFRGMSDEETFALTRAMEKSGDTIDLGSIPGIKVDKHSTGGVGDKTTLTACPVAACAGVPIAKMSGRGLGFTGGTADKLESIPGFRTSVRPEDFFDQVRDIGISVITQTARITPADKMLYALRDVTGTVENRSLIASSIMSKKLASGSDAIVLDVKCGSGAFMHDIDSAVDLAKLMISIGESAGRKMSAVISDMDQPLGRAVGNALEVKEAIDVLKGHGPSDITELTLVLASQMILAGGKAGSEDEARRKAGDILMSGSALEKLREMIERQGGDPRVTDDSTLLTGHPYSAEVRAAEGGYISSIDTMLAGEASQHAGAGRLTKDDVIDPLAGIVFSHKTGEHVETGETLATVFSADAGRASKAADMLAGAFSYSDEKPAERKLVKEIISGGSAR